MNKCYIIDRIFPSVVNEDEIHLIMSINVNFHSIQCLRANAPIDNKKEVVCQPKYS